MRRPVLLWSLAAIAGIVLVAAVTGAASRLSTQAIGLSSEPLNAGGALAPADARETPTATPAAKPKAKTKQRKTTPKPAATPTAVPTAVPTVDDNGGSSDGHGSDDGGGDDHGGGSDNSGHGGGGDD
jgi:hypothetical protein